MEPKINLFEFFLQAMTALFFIAIAVMQWQRSVRRNTHRRGTRRTSLTVSSELTMTNVMEYIERSGVSKRWKQLGEELCGKSAELDKISSLSAMIEFWLSHSRTTPSWRSLVWALDAISETTAAEDLMDIFESSQDTTVTVENLSSVLYIVAPEKRESIWHDLHFPLHRLRAIDLSGVEDCTHASISYYVSCCPDLSVVWTDLYCSLYRHGELPALDKVKEFCCITQNSLFTVENIAAIMTEWEPEDMYSAFTSGDQPLLPHSQLDIILKQYDTMEEQCQACAEYCVNYNPEYYLHPDDVWNKLAVKMNEAGASQESVMIVEAIKERFAAEQKDDSEILPPIVIKHPKDLSKTYGEEVTLSVAIINSGTLSYQWVKDEKNIESDKFDGNLTSTLKIKSFTPEHVGSYKCRVSNEAGSVDSKCGHIRDGSPLLELDKNGYVCIARNLLGFVYQPENVQTQKIEFKVINNKDCGPITRATELLLTPIVQLTSCDMSTMNPSIVELMKIASLSDDTDSKPLTVVVLFSPDSPQEWKELGVRLDESKVLNSDRISFEASKFGYYAVIIQFPLPSASAVVVPNHKMELKVPDLPGFKLEVPPESVEGGTEIQTIVHFDGPMLSIEGDHTPQASPCIEIRPHGLEFAEEVPIEMPIPKYTEIMNKHSEAKLQVWHSPSDPSENAKLEWTVHDMQIKISADKDDNIIALVHVNHSGEIMYKWKANDVETFDKDAVSSYYKKRSDLVKGRCTVLMSEVLPDESIDEFLIAAYVYPFCEEGYTNPEYPYRLHDSGNLPVNIKVGNLTYDIELKNYLNNYKATESAMFLGECCSYVQFCIPCTDGSKLGANRLLGRVFLKHSSGQELQRFYLKMPRCSRGKSIAAEENKEPGLIVISLSSAVVADLEKCPQLNIKNLIIIMKSFWLARARWFNIGLCVGFEYGDLLAIERSPPFDVDGCFRRMLAQWLNHTKPIPTWIALRQAFESKTVNVKLVIQEEGKPRVIEQPLTLNMSYGDEATFTVVATGTEPLIYQWKSDGSQIIGDSKRIFGVKTNTLRIRQLQLEHTGVYTCIITNGIGQIESVGATLSLKPKVTESPRSLNTAHSEEAVFTVSATGSQPLDFQWMKDEKNIFDNEKYRGTNANKLIIQSLDSKDVGCYNCMVKNPFGEDISEGAMLILKLEITEQPLSIKSHCSSDAVFDVTAVGSDPLSYQWKTGNKNVTDNDTYAGAMTSKLTIKHVTVNHMGVYSCTIKDQFGKCESHEATLIIEYSKACFQNLLELLDLTKHYPQKLTLHDAVRIRSETLGTGKCTDTKKLSLFVLQNIMAYSRLCRSNLLNSLQHESTSEDSDSSSSEKTEDSGKIHPMDNILALLHCADDFLRQCLMARLVICQLSIPFILPDPSTGQLTLLLWAMKSIVKEWKSTIKGSVTIHEGPLISYPTPTVAFVRFSKQEWSKSAIMNEVISDSYLDSFFHRDCEGGSFVRHLGEGLIDLCWYLPAGKADDTFSDTVAFLNLHGDARKHPKQIDFFSKFCLTNFVLLSEEDVDKESIAVLKTLSVAPGGIVLLMCSNISTEKVHQLTESIPHEKRIGCKLTRKNMNEIKRTVRSQIWKKLDKVYYNRDSLTIQTIEDCKNIAHNCNICVDEEKAEISEAKRLASQIYDMISENVMHAKANMLPLQGTKLWQRWAEKDKEQHRQNNRGSKKIEVYNDEMHTCKKKLRQLQLEEVRKPSSVLMEHFLTSIMQCDKSTRNYFLQYLKLLLNDLSNTASSKLRYEYGEERKKLLKLDNDDRDHQAVVDCKRMIEKLSEQITGAIFGLKDFFRELGQVYEATYQTSVEHKYQNLPRLAAELLFDGNPLELMDGDTGHVPIQWIEAVMHEVIQLLHNPRVFIISVIGLESTGKSTMMNTMFGQQLNVCAVRATRGVFIQLLPLCDGLRKEAKCDYVLIVDTEGLQAANVDTLSHDNQLATFVVGLADLTLINIFGEVPGDMDDILQVTVHALLRMKSLKLKPSCQFVHQNAGVNIMGVSYSSRFKHKLDHMTRVAAKEEECDSQFQSFNDVINFNTEDDVHYFQGLWRGNPPMAPVNEGYSCTALRLKTHLIDVIKHLGTHQLSAIEARVKNLWKAMLQENYIFNFKNTLEITAYKDLHAETIKWEHQLGVEMCRWEDEQALKINNLKEDNFKAFKHELLSKSLPETMQDIYEGVKGHMVCFFEESVHVNLLIQWKRATEHRLHIFQLEMQDNAIKYLMGLIQGKQLRNKFKHTMPQYHAQLIYKVKELIDEGNLILRNEGEDDLIKIFDEEWKKWLESTLCNVIEQIDTEEAVEKCLMNHFTYVRSKVISRLRYKPLRMWGTCLDLEEEPTHEHINLKQQTTFDFILLQRMQTKFDPHQNALTAMQIQLIKSTAKYAFRHVQEYLQSIQDKHFHPSFTQEILNTVARVIDSSSSQLEFTFTKDYKIAVSLTACGYAVRQFEKMVDDFRRQNDPILYLETEMKDVLYTYFKNQYFQLSEERVAASKICEVLAVVIDRAVSDSLGIQIIDGMRSSYRYLYTKSSLITKILLDLGENIQKQSVPNLDDYFLYLSDVKTSLRMWIKRYIRDYCNEANYHGEKNLVIHARDVLSTIFYRVMGNIENSKLDVGSSSGSFEIKTWLSKVCSACDLDIDMTEVKEDLILLNRSEYFTEILQKEILTLQSKLRDKCKNITVDELDKGRYRPFDILFDKLCGCTAQCPFCNEVCAMTEHSDVKHNCLQHRPFCLSGNRHPFSVELCPDVCTFLVTSDQRFSNSDTNGKMVYYKDYQTIYPNWSIIPNMSVSASIYWKWFLGRYSTEVALYFGMKDTQIPSSWRHLRWNDVAHELKRECHL